MPIEVIPNFVDTALFSPATPRDPQALAALLPRAASLVARSPGLTGAPGTTGRPRVLVHNSNFRPLKRVDRVVRILARVRARHPDCVLLLVGDGPERSRVEALVRELGLADAVCFLGKQRAVADALRHADLFLLPSETESFGLAALEAQSAGVPVIASATGGLPELIEDGVTGVLCPVGDDQGMAEAACALLSDEGWHQAMSEAARARVLLRFEAEPAVARYEALYRRVLAGSEAGVATSSSRRPPW